MFNLTPMFWSDQAGEPFFEIGQYLAKALQLLKRMESSEQILYIKRYYFTFTLSTLLLCLAKSFKENSKIVLKSCISSTKLTLSYTFCTPTQHILTTPALPAKVKNKKQTI